MRVRISYGVDIKDVPEKVRELFCDSLRTIRKAQELLERAVEDSNDAETNSAEILSILERTRKELGAADLCIVDSQSIMQGLNNYYNGDENVPERRSTMDTSRDPASET